MSAHHFVFVKHDGSALRTDVDGDDSAPQWLIRDGVAYQRDNYACAHCSDDEQEGAVVYVERPMALYMQERERRQRNLDHSARQLADMPMPPNPRIEGEAVECGRNLGGVVCIRPRGHRPPCGAVER